jgi:hypothetical protein
MPGDTRAPLLALAGALAVLTTWLGNPAVAAVLP